MKKLLVFLLAFSLVGCAEKKETKTSYCTQRTSDPSGLDMDAKYDFEYEGDQVVRQVVTLTNTFTNDLFFENGVLTDTVKQLLQDEIDKITDKVKDDEGVQYKTQMTDTQLIETYTIDYSKVKNETLVAIGLLSSADQGADFISMDKTITNLEKLNFTCTKN